MRNFIVATLLFISMGASRAEPIEIGFSPDSGAEDLVLKLIHSSRKSIRLAAYSFTSKSIIQALVAAKKRGLDVQCVLDDSSAKTDSGQAAANLLINAGVSVWVDSQHAIYHNKFIVVDNASVETGSFNYSKAAAHSNAENAMVLWNEPGVAKVYLANWQSHANHSEKWHSQY